jgi:hypothetical protein
LAQNQPGSEDSITQKTKQNKTVFVCQAVPEDGEK